MCIDMVSASRIKYEDIYNLLTIRCHMFSRFKSTINFIEKRYLRLQLYMTIDSAGLLDTYMYFSGHYLHDLWWIKEKLYFL